MSLRNNTLWNLAGSALPLLAAAAFIPYMLKTMGNEAFGVLTLIWALIGYFSLFDLGVGRSLTYEISKLIAENDSQTIRPTIYAGLILTGGTGILGAVLLWCIAPMLVGQWLRINPLYQSDVIDAFRICALAIVPTTITSGLRGALEGFNRFAASNLSKIILGFGMFTLPALALALHGVSLTYIAAYLCAIRLVISLLSLWQITSALQTPSHSLTSRYFYKLFNYGFWVTITGIVSPMMVYGDRFFVSAIVGASALAFYAIPQEGLLRVLMIPAAISSALLPLLVAQKGGELKTLYQSNLKRVTYLMFSLCLLIAAVAYPAMTWWLSPEFAQQSIVLTLIFLVGIGFNGIAIVPYTFLQARGRPATIAIFHLIELCVYLPLIWTLTSYFGLQGTAVAWLIRVSIDCILLQIATHHIIKSI